MLQLTEVATIRYLQKKYGFRFSKGLGQNFLLSTSVLEKIISASNACGQNMLEIGPGFGTLTIELCKVAKKVVCVELDSSVLPVLNETLASFNNYTLLNEDILKTDVNRLAAQQFDNQTFSVAANLPYYITTPVIMMLLEQRIKANTIVLMVQQEVAERLTAPHNCKEYGVITVMARYYAQIEIIENVESSLFYPSPKVNSAVIRITPYANPLYPDLEVRQYQRIVKGAFAQRRKTLLNSLCSDSGLGGRVRIAEVLNSIGINPSVRGESLTGDQFAQITRAFFVPRAKE